MDANTKTAQRLLQAFMQFHRLHTHQRSMAGLKPSEIAVLHCIRQQSADGDPGVKVSEISHTLRVTAPTVSQMVNGLVAGGLVERTPDSRDRRAVRIRLTEKGQKAWRRVVIEAIGTFTGLVDHLGKEDSDKLAELLSRVFTYFRTTEKNTDSNWMTGDERRC